MTLDCLLKLLEYHPDEKSPHVKIKDYQSCKKCDTYICISICPAQVFQRCYIDKDEPILINHIRCMECGICRLVCPENNIDFAWPAGGRGICFHDGVSVYPGEKGEGL